MIAVVEAALARCRLGVAPTAYAESFTVDQAQALQRQRHRPGTTRWSWTLQVLRGLFALTDGAQFMVTPPRDASRPGVRLRFAFDASTLDGFAPHGLLHAALEPDAGAGDGTLATRRQRFVRLLARGINESLAFGPCRVDVRIARRLYHYEVADGGTGETEHVEDLPPSPEIDACALEIEVVIDSRVGRWFEALMGADGFRETLELWFARVPGVDLSVQPGVLRPVPKPLPIRFGALGSWWPSNHPDGLTLLRDGVLVKTLLGRDLAMQGVTSRDFAGSIEAPQLRLTFDESSVVLDPQLSALVAWFGDVRAHGRRLPLPVTFEESMMPPVRRRYEGRIVSVVWPETIHHVQTVAGTWFDIASLQHASASGREIPYCWTHERAMTPEPLRATTLMLWPRELETLQRIPGLRIVPLAALHIGAVSDWASLVQVSYPELQLGSIARTSEIPVRLDVSALVHRRAEATQGRIEIAAHGGVLADIREPTCVLPGVLLVGRVAGNDMATSSFGPAAQQAALRAIELHARARIDDIVAHAREHKRPEDDAPLLRVVDRDGASVLATPAIEAIQRAAEATPPLLRIDVAYHGYGGALHVLERGHRGAIEVWRGGQSCGTVVLPDPWSRIGGDIGVQSPTMAVDDDTITQLAVDLVRKEVERRWSLAPSGSALAASLDELARTPRIDVAPIPVVEPLAPGPLDIGIRGALAAIVGPPDVDFEQSPTWVPAKRCGATIQLGALHPWILTAQTYGASRYHVSIATMLSLITLVTDPIELEAAVLRYLAVFCGTTSDAPSGTCTADPVVRRP